MACFCEHGNEFLDIMQAGNFLFGQQSSESVERLSSAQFKDFFKVIHPIVSS